MVSDLLKAGVVVNTEGEEEPSLLMNIFVSWFPMLLLIAVFIFSCARCRVAAGVAVPTSSAKAKLRCWANRPIR